MRDETLLFRQVNPQWIQAGRVTSQVFRPTPKDEEKLSVYDGDKIEPEKSWEHFTQQLRFKSAGVLAVACLECNSEQLPVTPDPEPFPEHVVIVFQGLSGGQCEKKGKK